MPCKLEMAEGDHGTTASKQWMTLRDSRQKVKNTPDQVRCPQSMLRSRALQTTHEKSDLTSVMWLPLSFAFLLPALAAAITTNDSIVLPFGNVQGTKCKHSGAKSFLGIPFAKPPVGELRFMPPKLVTLTNATFSNGVLDATKLGSTCIQWKKVFAWDEPPPSEDW